MTGGQNSPSGVLPKPKRKELLDTVSEVVTLGRSALAHVEIELARVEQLAVDARTKLDELRKVLDDLEATGERVRGSARG